MKIFRDIFFSRYEPQDGASLWLRPTKGGDGAELFVRRKKGWTEVGPMYILSRLFSSVSYDVDSCSLTFFGRDGDTLCTVTLDNLSSIISESVTDASINEDSGTIAFSNANGDTVSDISIDELFEGGDGISIGQRIISLKLDTASESYLTLSSDGLKLSGLDERFETIETDIDNLENRMDTAETDIDNLEERMDTAEADIDTAKTDIDALEERMTFTEGDVASLKESTARKLFAGVEYNERNNAIYFTDVKNKVLATVDCTAFTKDSALKAVFMDTSDASGRHGPFLHFVFNEDADMDDIYISLAKLKTIYHASDSIIIDSTDTIYVNPKFIAEYLPEVVKYAADYSEGLTVGHLVVNNNSDTVVIPYASAVQYGIVQAGNGIASFSGEISADVAYDSYYEDGTLVGYVRVGETTSNVYVPYASADVAGVVALGNGVNIEDGVLNVAVGYETDYSSGLTIGKLIIGDSTVDVKVPYGSASQYGVFVAGNGLSALYGVLSADVTYSGVYNTGVGLGTINVGEQQYTLYMPLASSEQAGAVKLGSGLQTSEGAITVDIGYNGAYSSGLTVGTLSIGDEESDILIPVASSSQMGVVILGNGIESENGVIYAEISYSSNYSGLTLGQIIVGDDKTDVTAPYATAIQAGLITVGEGLNVSDEGNVFVDSSYITNLAVNGVSYATYYSDGLELGALSNGDIVIAPFASKTQAGVVEISNGLSVADGTISVQRSGSSEDYLFVDSTGVGIIGIEDIASRLSTVETDMVSLKSLSEDASDNIESLLKAVSSSLGSVLVYDEATYTMLLNASDGTTLSSVDVSSFIKDGMLKAASVVTNPDGYDEGTYLRLVFNTDAGQEDIYVNVNSLVTVYTAGDGINITDWTVSVDTSYIEDIIGDSVIYESEIDSGLSLGTITINGVTKRIRVPYATSEQIGVVNAGEGLSVSYGTLSVDESYIKTVVGEEYIMEVVSESYIQNALSSYYKHTPLYSNGLETDRFYLGSSFTSSYVPYASESQFGVVRVGTGLVLSDDYLTVSQEYITGLINTDYIYSQISGEYIADILSEYIYYENNYDEGKAIGAFYNNETRTTVLVPYASSSMAGVAKIGYGLSVSDNTISLEIPVQKSESVYLVGLTSSSATSVSDLYRPTKSVGSGVTPIYMVSGGSLTASTSTVGNSAQPVYMNAGTLTECTSYSLWLTDNIANYIGDGLLSTSGVVSVDDSYIENLISEAVSYTVAYEAGLAVGTLTVNDDDTSVTVPYGTSTQYGVVMTSDGLLSTSGVVSVDDSYIESLVSGGVSYSGDYTSGLTIGSITVNDNSESIIIPYGTSIQYGVVKVGSGLTSTSGELSVTDSYITGLINEDYIEGIITSYYVEDIIDGYISFASSYASGLTIGTATIGSTTVTYRTPYGTSTQYGVVMTGSGLLSTDGVVSVDDSYMQSLVSGGVSYTGNYDMGLIVGSILVNDGDTQIIIPYGTATQYGVVMVGSGLTSTSGVLSITDSYITELIDSDYLKGIIDSSYVQGIVDGYVSFEASFTSGLTIGSATVGNTIVTYITPYTSSSQYGVMMTGSGLSVTSGTVSVDDDYLKSVIDEEYIESVIDIDYIAGLISGGSVAGLMNISTSTETVYIAGVTSTTETTTSTLYRPTVQVGSDLIPIYLNSEGALTASTSTVGNSAQPVYMNAGTLTECTSYSLWLTDNIANYIGDGLLSTSGVVSVDDSYITGLIDADYISGLGFGGDSGSTVAWIGALTDGVAIGTLEIDGVTYTLYAPSADNAEAGITIGATTATFYPIGVTSTASGTYTTAYRHSSAVGDDVTPIYLNSEGALTASTSTVGNSAQPVYMNAGTLTECGESSWSGNYTSDTGVALGVITLLGSSFIIYAPEATSEGYESMTWTEYD